MDDRTPKLTVAEKEDTRSLGQIVSELLGDVSTLFRQEVALAKTEMTEKASRAAKDAVGVIAGGIVLHTGILVLLVALVAGLSLYMQVWLAALLVGGVLALVGAIVLANGLKNLQKVNPIPERTLRTVRDDAQYVKEKISNG